MTGKPISPLRQRMKGTMSELELSLFRQRSQEALKQKARRGALFLGVAAGYVKAGRDRIEKDPDQRVQEAIRLVFAKFAELQSARQVHVWLREEGIALPVKAHDAEGRTIVWRLPAYNTVHNMITNPVYAGAYAFGRTTSKVIVADVPGSRRVVVKARIVRHRTHAITAANAHLRYIQRDGVTRDGKAGTLYSHDHDDADGKAFLARSDGERHQFRLIVAAEDGSKIADLKPFIRDLMGKVENDLGTRLDWVAVDHHNTGHPHTHIIIRGRDEHGRDLVIAKSYISHGIRAQAQRLVTLELGPEIQIERLSKLRLETAAPRLTPVDRSISREAKENVWAFDGSGSRAHQMRSVKIARLKALQRLGLAAERRPGVFEVDPQLVRKLQSLGVREERYAATQRTLKEVGLAIQPSQISLWSAAGSGRRTKGVLIGRGLVDDGSERHYLVLRGENGRIVYAEVNMKAGQSPPEPGTRLALIPGGSSETAIVRQIAPVQNLGRVRQ